jgi:hypothetical protein
MAAPLLERWLANPALVDHTRRLVKQISECLENQYEFIHKNRIESPTPETSLPEKPIHRQKTGSLIDSDMLVIENIVKLRNNLKASQLELYKTLLSSIIKRGDEVAR